jgi:hypothetical protein
MWMTKVLTIGIKKWLTGLEILFTILGRHDFGGA